MKQMKLNTGDVWVSLNSWGDVHEVCETPDNEKYKFIVIKVKKNPHKSNKLYVFYTDIHKNHHMAVPIAEFREGRKPLKVNMWLPEIINININTLN